MKIQDLISEMSKFDSELDIVSSYNPTEVVISLDCEIKEENEEEENEDEEKEEEEEFYDDRHLIEMSYFDFGNDDRLK